ncbi:hypothetical protein [Clostridium combesii]|uniref:ROK family protein n=1 Tax=Clostridium combesii TaxID=39481 RepID=A0A2G7HGC6_9CLOT|nr:hypothetical protein [Clostridium combesii]PIH04177.1 hypothetical protein CS538_10665 [Clostridium combesii]
MKNSADIRKFNIYKIQRILWNGGEHTKQQIAIDTGLSVATCNTLLNDMEKSGEVIGNKKRIQEVGRSTITYQVNESYESILCISFELIKGKKSLKRIVLSPLGNILSYTEKFYKILDYCVIKENISEMISTYSNISQIMIGTPSVAEHGIIKHCDIEELENQKIVEEIESCFKIPVYLENDMHFKIYGYYKKEGVPNDIITIVNFPSNVLPGTASIHAGTIIKGKNKYAGMLGFLPFGINRKDEVSLKDIEIDMYLISKSIAYIIAIINPNIIVFTGDLFDEDIVEYIKNECLNTIPEEYMPEFLFIEDINTYYLEGMYQKSLDLKGIL